MTEQTEHTAREVKQAVVEQYGARARRAMEVAGGQPAAAAAACCGDDCCAEAPAQASVASPIEFVSISGQTDAACCGDDCCSADSVGNELTAAQRYYAAADVDTLPDSVTLASAGCGNPIAVAELAEGERVLDLGSGGGIDCFLAARRVGDGGAVWGLDMTPDMIALARHNAAELALTNVQFRLGEIEDIPFGDEHFDVIMSNCVINLSPDKPRVFAESFRVLRPGGRFRVSDMVWTREIPSDIRASIGEWAACIAGAPRVEDYLDGLRAAGFMDVAANYTDSEQGIVSAYITATKPE